MAHRGRPEGSVVVVTVRTLGSGRDMGGRFAKRRRTVTGRAAANRSRIMHVADTGRPTGRG